jgi:hypothetical protein
MTNYRRGKPASSALFKGRGKLDTNMANVLIHSAWSVQEKYVSLVLVKHQATRELPNLIHNIPVNWENRPLIPSLRCIHTFSLSFIRDIHYILSHGYLILSYICYTVGV